MSDFEVVDSEQLHEVEVEEGRCPACGLELYAHEVERNQPVCDACDRRLERQLVAWLDFAAIRDE